MILQKDENAAVQDCFFIRFVVVVVFSSSSLGMFRVFPPGSFEGTIRLSLTVRTTGADTRQATAVRLMLSQGVHKL